jgi:hypothetical protein
MGFLPQVLGTAFGAGLCLPKKIDVDFKPGTKHQQQPAKVPKELHDRMENFEGYQAYEFWNSDAACKCRCAGDNRHDNRETLPDSAALRRET